MKRIITSIVLFVFTITNGQVEVGNYQMSYFSQQDILFKVKAGSFKKATVFKFYVEVLPQNDIDNNIDLIIKSNKVDNFISNLKKAKEKYLEWKETALKNNIEKVIKRIKVKRMNLNARFKKYGKWYYDYHVEPIFNFAVIDGKPILMIENKITLASSSNKFITNKGFYIIFQNENEIDDFIKSFDKNKAVAVFNKLKNNESLFKD